MYLANSEIDYEVMTGQEALHEIDEIGMDLRGA